MKLLNLIVMSSLPIFCINNFQKIALNEFQQKINWEHFVVLKKIAENYQQEIIKVNKLINNADYSVEKKFEIKQKFIEFYYQNGKKLQQLWSEFLVKFFPEDKKVKEIYEIFAEFGKKTSKNRLELSLRSFIETTYDDIQNKIAPYIDLIIEIANKVNKSIKIKNFK